MTLQQQDHKLEELAADGETVKHAAATSSLPPDTEHTKVHTKLPDEHIVATAQDKGKAADVKMLDSRMDDTMSHHAAAQPDHAPIADKEQQHGAPATSDATTVTGDQDGAFEAVTVPAIAPLDEVHSQLHHHTPPHQALIDPADPAAVTVAGAANAGHTAAAVEDQTSLKPTSSQQQHTEQQHAQSRGEPTNGAIRPPTTRQVACAARTILSLSRGDTAPPDDRLDPSMNGAATQRSCGAPETGVLPPRTPAKAKEINSLAAVLAGGTGTQHAQPADALRLREAAMAHGRHAGTCPPLSYSTGFALPSAFPCVQQARATIARHAQTETKLVYEQYMCMQYMCMHPKFSV